MVRTRWLAALVLALPTCTPSASQAQGSGRSVHVDAAHSGPSDGSIARPFTTLQAAVDAARDGDAIKVAAGRYEHGNVDMKSKALSLLGGFAGKGDFGARDPTKNRTIVVGKRETSDYEKNRAAVFYWVASEGGTIDGFTITGGRHGIFTSYTTSEKPLVVTNNVIEDNGIDKPGYHEHGGGIHTEYKNVEIVKNVVRKNKSGRGGGIAVLGPGAARIEDNLVEENVGLGDHGGGLFVAQKASVKNNVIRKNEVTGAIIEWVGGVGGGLIALSAAIDLSDNRITDNYAKKCGGGLFVDEGARVTMSHDIVFKNRPAHPQGWGGSAIYVDGGTNKKSTLLMRHVTVADNAPKGAGKGNGIFVAADGEVTVVDSIFANNGGAGGDFFVDEPAKSRIDVSYSIARGAGPGIQLGAGMVAGEPAFADAAAGDYHLKSRSGRWDPRAADGKGGWQNDSIDSPGIDAADPKSPFDREPAPNGNRANLGSDGNTSYASRSATGGGPPPAVAAATASAATAASAPAPRAEPEPTKDPSPARPVSGGCAGCTLGRGAACEPRQETSRGAACGPRQGTIVLFLIVVCALRVRLTRLRRRRYRQVICRQPR